MSSHPPVVALSSIDEERFGIKSARATIDSPGALAETLDFCRANQVIFLVARCPAAALHTVHAMEREGFLLMDTLLYYMRHLDKPPIPEDNGEALIRSIRPGEEHVVHAIATDSFQGYFGHYHADERLPDTLCDEVYISWAVRACLSSEVADEVMIAEIEGKPAGFFVMRLLNDEESEGMLAGIARWARRRGIYHSFLIKILEWSQRQGVQRMRFSTQVTNVPSQNAWVRVGAELSYAYYTFHKWFDLP